MPTQYVEMPARSILNRLPHDRYPFNWSINLYRGCRHGCPFCYARHTHRFLGYEHPRDFQEIIEVKINAPEILAQELASPHWSRSPVALGTATDCYQPAERKYRLTRQALALLARFRTPVMLSTKSDLVLRDIDMLQQLTRRCYVGVAMSIITLNPRIEQFLEPWAVPVKKRLEALVKLKDAGITTGIHLMPVLPLVNDDAESLADICKAAKDAGVDYLAHSRLHLRGQVVRGYFFRRLHAYNPELFQKYRLLFDNATEPPDNYTERTDRTLQGLMDFYGLTSDLDFIEAKEKQMELFDTAAC